MKAGWQSKKLRDVCELINGRAYNKPELLDEGKYRVLRVGNFFTNNHWYYSDLELEDKKYCDNGDLLYAWSASFGPRIWTGEKVIFHYHIWKIMPDFDQIDQKFLFNFLLWDTEQIKEDQGTGTTMMHVSKGSMEDRDILLPPLTEQQRIVAILDEVFDCIAAAKTNAEKNLKNARELFESHLQSVFTQSGDGWVARRLGDVFEIGSSKRIMEKDWVSTGVPFYGGREIVKLAKVGSVISNAYISEEKYQDYASKYDMPRQNDILITARGTIGVGYIVKEADKFYYKDGNIISMRAKAFANPYFMLYAFKSNVMLDQLGELTGTTVRHLPIEKAKELILRIPEFETQNSVVMKIRKVEEETQRLESIYKLKIKALDELKKSLLHKAFSGQL